MKTILLMSVLLLGTSPLPNKVIVQNAELRLPPGGTGSGALYLRLKNTASKPDRLLSARTTVATNTMLHETVMDGEVAKMVHATHWSVPAGGELVLAPSGKHIMLMGMTKKTKPGDRVRVELVFEVAGVVTVDAEAKAFTTSATSGRGS